jgi:hypothetical protein
MDTLDKRDVLLFPYPPYSPDIAICDLRLFPTLKDSLNGTKFESREDLMCAVDRQLWEMSCDGLQHVFESWVERWDECKWSMGRYFELGTWIKSFPLYRISLRIYCCTLVHLLLTAVPVSRCREGCFMFSFSDSIKPRLHFLIKLCCNNASDR